MAKSKPDNLYQRPGSDAWYYDFRLDGKRYRGSTGETDQKLANKKLVEIENSIKATAALGLAPDAAGRNVEDITYNLAVIAKVNILGEPIREATRGYYATKGGHLNRLLRTCGGCDQCAVGNTSHDSLTLAELKAHHVTKFRDHRLAVDGAAAATVKKELNVLAAAIKQAASLGWCKPSLAVDVIPKLKPNGKVKTRWLTPEEYLALLDALDTSLSPQHLFPRLSKVDPVRAAAKAAELTDKIRNRQLYVTVACFTGAERSILERLTWEDIDFTAGTIRLRGTKSEYRDRTIDLDPHLRQALLRVSPVLRSGRVLRPWQNACHELHLAAERAGFAGKNKPRSADPDYVDYGVTPHTFRHTFGSWLVQAGVPTFTVAKLMGHRDSKMVEVHYGHLAPKNKSDAITKLPTISRQYAEASDPAHCAQTVPNTLPTSGAHGAGSLRGQAPGVPRSRGTSQGDQPLSFVSPDGIEPSTLGLKGRGMGGRMYHPTNRLPTVLPRNVVNAKRQCAQTVPIGDPVPDGGVITN